MMVTYKNIKKQKNPFSLFKIIYSKTYSLLDIIDQVF